MRARLLLAGLAAVLLAAPARADESDAGTPDAAADAGTSDAGDTPTPVESAAPNAPPEPEGRAASASPETAPAPAAAANPPADQSGAAPADAGGESSQSTATAPTAVPSPVEAAPPPAPVEPSPLATPSTPRPDAPATSEGPAEDKSAGAPATPAPEASEPPPAPPVAAPPRPSPRARPIPIAKATNDVALELGWNAPVGTGVRYLHHFAGTSWALGAGLGLSLWGSKLSLIARRADDYLDGSFFQFSFAASSGADDVEKEVVTPAGPEKARFRETPGRTLDVVYGYRWNQGQSFLEAFGGWSFRIRGTGLQKTDVALDEATRGDFNLRSPGGIAFGATWGRLF